MSFLLLFISMWGSLMLFLMRAEGLPYMLLQNTRPKCLSVAAPRGTTLLVHYDVPDMVIISEDDNEEPPKQKENRSNEEMQQNAGLDTRYQNRFQQKLEAMKRAGRQMRDVSIVVSQKADTIREAREARRQSRTHDGGSGKIGTGRLREELTEKQGRIEFVTGTTDGMVEICVQSISANPSSPVRVSLGVEERVTRTHTEAKQAEQTLPEDQRKAKEHMTRMEGDLMGLNHKVDMILSNADYAKEQEVQFHEQSLAMNRASQWWPMLHLFILLITGFTQANHIVRFFRQRHIF